MQLGKTGNARKIILSSASRVPRDGEMVGVGRRYSLPSRSHSGRGFMVNVFGLELCFGGIQCVTE